MATSLTSRSLVKDDLPGRRNLVVGEVVLGIDSLSCRSNQETRGEMHSGRGSKLANGWKVEVRRRRDAGL